MLLVIINVFLNIKYLCYKYKETAFIGSNYFIVPSIHDIEENELIINLIMYKLSLYLNKLLIFKLC